MSIQAIYEKYTELKNTDPRNSQFKHRVKLLKDLIKQYNYHVEDRFRLVEVSQYPSVYELKEVQP